MEVARGSQAADQAVKRAALQNHDLIGVATLVAQTKLPETPSYTEGVTHDTKSEGFQGRMEWFQKEGLLFLPGNLQWKLLNFLYATTHLGEKALRRLLEMSFRGTGLQRAVMQVVASCPTCQLNNPQGVWRTRLVQPIQWLGIYPGEDWQIDFTQMPVFQRYEYLLVMIDTCTGWIEGFPTQTEKVEEVVKSKQANNKNCSMKSFQDTVCPGDYRVTIWHHLLPRSPKGFLKHWTLPIISIVPGGLSLQENKKRTNQFLKSAIKKITWETSLGWKEALPIALFHIHIALNEQIFLGPYDMLYGRPFVYVNDLFLDPEAQTIRSYTMATGQFQ